MPDCPYWRRLRTTPWTKTFRRSWDDDGVVGNKVYPSYLLLFDRGFSQNGSLGEKTLVSKRITSTYDPEAVFGHCVGQWVVGSLPKVLSINLSAGMQNYLLSHTYQ